MKSKLLFAVLALVAAAITAPTLCRANTITFETSPVGNFTGLTTENGFTYSRLSGGLFLNTTGNPGHDMEGTVTAGGGVLKIISAGSGDFNFNSLQFVAAGSTATGSQTLSVEGLLNGSPVGTDTYTKRTALPSRRNLPLYYQVQRSQNLILR